MSPSNMQDAKEQIRQAIDIVDLVGGYMALRRQGSSYVAVCPWHDDTRPSLQVNPARQSFKCWVCDIGGDIFSFLMRMEGLEFREALEMLADRAGVELKRSRAGQSSPFERRNLLQAMAWAEGLFHECLLHDPAAGDAREYLAARGLWQDTIAHFQLGFAPDRWDWLLGAAGPTPFSPVVLERVGLVARRQSGTGYYDRFRGRLMFPIRDTRGRPIAFGGRVLPSASGSSDDRPVAKYINSPETPLFNKSSQLYALHLAKEGLQREQGLVVMEGYTDVIMAHQHGITNAVAVLGTALGEKHVPLLRRFTDRITLVLDGDEAGQKRTMQILDDLLALFVSQEIDLRILALPEGADPCDVIVSQGRESFEKLLSAAVDALEHKIDTVTKGLESVSGTPGTHAMSQAIEQILGTLVRAFPATGGLTSTALVREQQVMSRLSRRFGMAEDTIRTRLVSKRREISRGQRSRRTLVASLPAHPQASLPKLPAWEQELIELVIHHPDAVAELVANLDSTVFRHALSRKVFEQAVAAHQAGQPLRFEQLMLATDDVAEKNLLVACDEQGREKMGSDTKQRIKDLLALVAQQAKDAWQHSHLAELKQSQLDPDYEKELLAKLFDDFKGRQAGPSPTDG